MANTGIKLKTTRGEIANYVAKHIVEKKKSLIPILQYIGEQCINDARLQGSYTDRTGNLRSSIGYVVVDGGEIVTASRANPVQGAIINAKGETTSYSGDEGVASGESYARELASQYQNGLVLIVVAGMRYASYVQDKGYNVIDSAERLAEQLVSQLLA